MSIKTISSSTKDSTGATPRESVDDPHRLALGYLRRRALEGNHFRFWRDEWWRWDGQRYCRLGDNELRAEVTQTVRAEFERLAAQVRDKQDEDDEGIRHVTRSLVANVTQALEGLCLVPDSIDQPAWLGPERVGPFIAVANGLLDLERVLRADPDALLVHSAEWFSPICLDYAYEPHAACPLWCAFLNEVMEGDQERIALLQEWCGYLLTVDTSLQKLLYLVGDGANGKTVFLGLLTALLGTENVSHVQLELFGERFQLSATLGKLANIVNEVG